MVIHIHVGQKWNKFARMRFFKSIFFFLALTFYNLGTIELQGSNVSNRITNSTSSFNNETGITGIWTGTLNAGGMQLKLEFHIKSIDNKTYRTYLSVPQQGAKDLPMDKTEVSKNKITIKSNILGAVFEGKWDQKNTITGTFKQNGQSFPLELTRGSVELKRPQTPKAPFPYNSKVVQFSNRQGTCRFQGTVTTPFDSIAKGTIILFSGSGAQNRDEEIFGHKPFAVLADTFTKAGYNVLRVDDRGAGYTVCKPSEIASYTTEDLIRDGESYIQFAIEQISKETPLILFGHSEGCSIIAALANKNPNVSKLIGFGPALISGADINTYQNHKGIESVLQDSQLTSHYLRLHTAILKLTQNDNFFELPKDTLGIYIGSIYAKWKKSTPVRSSRKIEKRFEKITKKKFLEYVTDSYHPLFQNAWMWHFLNDNARLDWERVQQNSLLINGELDIQTPVSLNQPAFQDYLKVKTNLTYTTLPDINHVFQRAKTGDISEYGTIETTIDPEVLRVIFEFLEKD